MDHRRDFVQGENQVRGATRDRGVRHGGLFGRLLALHEDDAAGPLHRGGACCRILAHAREHDGERTGAAAVGDRLEQQVEWLIEEADLSSNDACGVGQELELPARRTDEHAPGRQPRARRRPFHGELRPPAEDIDQRAAFSAQVLRDHDRGGKIDRQFAQYCAHRLEPARGRCQGHDVEASGRDRSSSRRRPLTIVRRLRPVASRDRRFPACSLRAARHAWSMFLTSQGGQRHRPGQDLE